MKAYIFRDLKFDGCSRWLLILLMACCSLAGSAQNLSVTATSGTASGSFTTLKGAFDAVNAGTHRGVIAIKINASTTEASSAVLNASGSGSASYTGITIYPTTTGLSITGDLAAPLIDLNGADNVTIDGRVNATGSTKGLTISHTSAANTAGTYSDRVYMAGSATSITSAGRAVSVTGTAGGADSQSVYILNAGSIPVCTNGNVTVSGTGGPGKGTGADHYGVAISGYTLIRCICQSLQAYFLRCAMVRSNHI